MDFIPPNWDCNNFFDIPNLLEYQTDNKVSDYIKKRYLERSQRGTRIEENKI